MSLLTLKKIEWSGTSSQTAPVESVIKPLEVLNSNISAYKLRYFRFTGIFSSVAECTDIETKEAVAVKIFEKGFEKLNNELDMLKRIRGLDPDNIVRFFESFEHKGHTCLAFERLDINLHKLLNDRHGNPFFLEQIKPITQQLLGALMSLKTAGVIHTEIKPHNIMVMNQKDQPIRVKVIDFGSAIASAEVKRGVIIQPEAYRSPDVILGLPISEAVDMWSLGGVLATLYLGSLPFPQTCQYYQMKTLVKTLGQPEDKLLSDGTHTLLYFSPKQNSTKRAWKLKTANEYKAATGLYPQKHRGTSTRFNCLDDLVKLNPEENTENKKRFVSLLRKMLHMNPQKRIAPSDALLHPFITLTQLDDDKDSPVEESSDVAMTSGVTDNISESNDASPREEVSDSSCSTFESGESDVAARPADDEAAVNSPSAGEAPTAPLTADSTDAHIGSDGVCSMMFRALCCCCSENAEQ